MGMWGERTPLGEHVGVLDAKIEASVEEMS